ncbi:PilZ domain-containing protein [Vibrio sp. SCSIO 43135]|uniref:Cyclic diguanosine monophosphate-binding protein n=1 Tax=Vibrio paucivorans TaxID=2829489 RepID=A0A9X3HSY8_9VIBR|nr:MULTISPECIES: PilZ domain-containing protein [Vibrio]MCW8335201.1 PilZ domain-containing protein [Vibrio paucivorans]USD42513.1 PilZ domain-containing protein [Vibrio sp. SCSIO 43135]
MVERRRFSRIIYQAPASIEQGNTVVNASIQDLSLHGLLLSVDSDGEVLDTDTTANIQFSLPDSDVVIQLVARLLSNKNNVIHASIDHIDIESIGHLRRLVELNVGDDSLLHRELEHLSDLGEHT